MEQEFDFILNASGRVSNTDLVKIDKTSLKLNGKGVPIYNDKTMQCGDSHIFIAGDANDDIPLLHEASDEGKIAGKNAALYPNVELGQRRTHLGIVFSDPEIAIIGKSVDSFENLIVGKVSFEGQGRSRVMGKNKGLMHLYAEKGDRRLQGAQIFGPSAEHLGHLISWVIQQELTVDAILDMPFYHPVVEEGLRTALQDLQKTWMRLNESSKDLEYFAILAKTRHFGQASTLAGVSQPALSIQIKKLEQELRVKLFERSQKTVVLTPEGSELLVRVEQILQQIKDFKFAAKQYSDPYQGQLIFGAFPTLAPYLFPKILDELHQSYPEMKFFIKEEKTDTLLQMLRQGKVDAAFIALPHEDRFFDSELIFSEEFLFAVSSKVS